jgi:hypothetical protein
MHRHLIAVFGFKTQPTFVDLSFIKVYQGLIPSGSSVSVVIDFHISLAVTIDDAMLEQLV